MNKDSLAYALGQVDARYILEAYPLESETTCKRRQRRWGMIVACLILTILLVAVVAVASGILDPLASYVQGEDDEVYLKEILGDSKCECSTPVAVADICKRITPVNAKRSYSGDKYS